MAGQVGDLRDLVMGQVGVTEGVGGGEVEQVLQTVVAGHQRLQCPHG